ncbi:MAG TPA: Hsp20/alpha crystallin family protein [Trueperaceae bacterium]|jgi:HSP20 family protein|nr:Hsp20/alpha crystallin family protein [Trueperaceae bacterium]
MKIQKYGTAGDIEELIAVRESIERLADAHGPSSPLVARADLHDTGEAYLVHVEVPGVPQSDLEVAVQGDELLIAGIRDSLPLDTAAIFTERPVGPFQRTIRLPSPVDPEQATAHLHSGVLTITLPKQR